MKNLMQSMKQNPDKILGSTIFSISLSFPSLVETQDCQTTNCRRKVLLRNSGNDFLLNNFHREDHQKLFDQYSIEFKFFVYHDDD